MSTNRVSSGSFTASSPTPSSSSSLRLSANVISSIHSQSETTEVEIAVSSDEGKEKNIKEEIHVEMKQDVRELLGRKFWEEANPLEIVCEVLFHIKRRGTTIEKEVYCGLIQFISCLYILPVLPHQMENAGYDLRTTYVVTALMSSFGSIVGGFLANLPLIIAPPTSISIFLSLYLQENGWHARVGDSAVALSGVLLIFLGWRPLSVFLNRLIPLPIQVGTAVGIGLLTALAGAIEIDLVVTGNYTVLSIGKITSEVIITIAGVIMVAAALHYQIKGAFCISMFFGSLVWWCHDNSWPTSIVRFPVVDTVESFFGSNRVDCIYLSLQLVFIYIISLSGLVSSMATLAGLVRKDNTTPRNRWIYVVCGVATLVSGLLSGPPVLISPESAGGIKAGAKTGLSTVVCGILFGLSVFFGPILENIPNAATAPLLLAVGIVLFQNVQKLNWKLITDSTPAYVVLFFIPFTYSILQGVVIGYLVYLILGVLTGQIFYSSLDLWLFYFEKNPFETLRSLFGREQDKDSLTDCGSEARNSLVSGITGDPDRPRAPSINRIEMDGLEDPAIHLTLGFEELTQETSSYFPTPATFKHYQESHRQLSLED